ncbi:ICMT-domain-containing protein [Aspergillus heteromorphus CBS 117.55]|uniref:Protein-S-isoprenylcysteine O-methyltransferase n=1 Tax=Aspergillus heteromorphus CBS 117.55 TaxID=1448321 RepID=A0A317VAQ3_9EURO|nr:ICMT-domain-containing protein [Aspergillus heteromorphus CBS 117.55]PWY70459.1 ICMT-domain-containing protein [Aspergillus heteromorphus CBS 117.55]
MPPSPAFAGDTHPASPSPSPSPTWRPYRPPPASASAAAPPPPSPPTNDSTIDNVLLPTGQKSLSGISLRAFLLGTVLGLSTSLTVLLLLSPPLYTPLWRIPFFLASLSLFHFLEYYITAAHNTRFANISAFLLSSNGWAYNIAHGSAVLECLLANVFFSGSDGDRYQGVETATPRARVTIQVLLGLVLMVVGQTVRSLAMAHAGSNFNHTVQVTRRDGHRLVTSGVYAVFRHPSYFGFFWWGLGTQLVLGNVVCLVGYAVVLWRFFSSRIYREEKFLVAFFGEEYEEYKKRSWVGIPGIY